mgnify:CR=1 FL=1
MHADGNKRDLDLITDSSAEDALNDGSYCESDVCLERLTDRAVCKKLQAISEGGEDGDRKIRMYNLRMDDVQLMGSL